MSSSHVTPPRWQSTERRRLGAAMTVPHEDPENVGFLACAPVLVDFFKSVYTLECMNPIQVVISLKSAVRIRRPDFPNFFALPVD